MVFGQEGGKSHWLEGRACVDGERGGETVGERFQERETGGKHFLDIFWGFLKKIKFNWGFEGDFEFWE